jgi:Protein of unknown function (DUF4058)
MPSLKNLYPGINPHLNSFLQKESGGWESFHAELVIQIRVILDAELPAGYLALAEKSLQISEIIQSTHSRTRPDVTIYQSTPSRGTSTVALASDPTATLSLLETIPDEEYLSGVLIYQVGEGSAFGRPVTRIEVLSPANKPAGSHYPRYVEKRIETLHSGLRLVEIDFLHETPPVIPHLASYPDGETDAHPYTIIVSDPRPEFEKGRVAVYGFGVADSIPRVRIPLAGADENIFDFGIAYHRVYESLRFIQSLVDYGELPANFGRYTEVDREWIQNYMAQIANSP